MNEHEHLPIEVFINTVSHHNKATEVPFIAVNCELWRHKNDACVIYGHAALVHNDTRHSRENTLHCHYINDEGVVWIQYVVLLQGHKKLIASFQLIRFKINHLTL